MKLISFSFLVILFFTSCSGPGPETNKEKQKEEVTGSKSLSTAPEYTVIAVEYPETGWGYQILEDGKLAIDQKHIPVIQGYRGFESKSKAEKTGKFIVSKMEKGIFPPTLTQAELDSLGVL
jgi:hypothetical protein